MFQDRDSDDSDIEVGDPESDGEDVANEEDLMRAPDDGDDHDDVDANDSQLDVDDSQLDIVLDDAGTSDDDDAGPALPKIPRLDASWTWEKCGKKRVEPQRLNGTRQEEVLVDMPDNPSPSDFFKLYVTDELLDMMALETNKYATQFIADNVGSLKPHSLVHQWKDTDKNEMAVLLGMMLHMGLVYKPRLSMYWSTDELFYTPIFSSVMPRDRFLILIRFLHFADNSACDVSDPARDRLHKIRPVIDFVKRRCREVYYPCTEVCVDESLVLFKGRLSFRQFIRTKRARFGIKIYQLCTSSGVLLDFLIYHGNSAAELTQLPDFLTTEKIPITLLQPYLNNGHILFTDNFYTTPRLAQYLLLNGTALVGTVRPNRKNFPKMLSSTSLGKGVAEFFTPKIRKSLLSNTGQ